MNISRIPTTLKLRWGGSRIRATSSSNPNKRISRLFTIMRNRNIMSSMLTTCSTILLHSNFQIRIFLLLLLFITSTDRQWVASSIPSILSCSTLNRLEGLFPDVLVAGRIWLITTNVRRKDSNALFVEGKITMILTMRLMAMELNYSILTIWLMVPMGKYLLR